MMVVNSHEPRRSNRTACLLGMALLLLTACSAEKNPDNQVWDQYDIRQPLPYNSQVPDSAVNRINRYDPYRYAPIDNDAYYQVPQGYYGDGQYYNGLPVHGGQGID